MYAKVIYKFIYFYYFNPIPAEGKDLSFFIIEPKKMKIRPGNGFMAIINLIKHYW